MAGPTGTLFDGENFNLQFKFGPKYPFDSPEVMFIGDDIPVHPHIYSNGHICLSILYDQVTLIYANVELQALADRVTVESSTAG